MSDAAQILAAHRLVRNDGELTARCTCGWESEPAWSRDGKHLMHEVHVLAVLSETHAVVELPEPGTAGWHRRRAETLLAEGEQVVRKIRDAATDNPTRNEHEVRLRRDDLGKKAMGIWAQAQVHATLAAARVAEATR